MNREERNNKLKAFITCLKCEVSGKCCNDNCPTQYEAGNMGEIIENLEVISKALEQEFTNSVLEDIKAEIQKLRNCSCSNSDGIIDDIEDIIDNHISGKENI